MGLLQRAKEQTVFSKESRLVKFDDLLTRLNQLKNNIEFYPNLFSELVNFFNIEKGALLVREGNNYIPLGITGFDETTKNRIRLSSNDFEEYLKNEDLTLLKKYFSIREGINLKNIFLATFKGNEILGILLISSFSTSSIPSLDEIQDTCSRLTKLLENNPLNKLKEKGELKLEVRDSVEDFSRRLKTDENRIIFIKLNFSNFIKLLQDNNTLLSPNNILSNCNRILKSFVGNRGEVFRISPTEMLLVLLDKSLSINIALIQGQINTAIKSIFTDIQNLDLDFETLIWNNNSLDTILDHLVK